ncbi:helix-turn-helix transcriptional regulator [Nocardia transvalensis]|uniref:helix-turn-helix transcriptional regulator n=1 Tax=Nocardia transvalensis TaxID=37333 RepID=UPI001894E2F3|nr:helix-turn-helix transcriptional regulator [Nocardia transvalensis]MBF6329230.1 helix-turn-helix transcriptional regulator [Nocardia transvalensis]
MHAHHSVQVLVARRGEFVLSDSAGADVVCLAAVIPADAAHAMTQGVEEGEMVHLAPESDDGSALSRSVARPESAAAWVDAGVALAARLGEDEWWADGLPYVRSTVRPRRHPAVTAAARLLPDLLEAGPVRLRDVSCQVGLSESRLAHLFSEEIGLPFRPYVRWLRMCRAVDLIAAGHSLTDAAHAAGFFDAAHLTRVSNKTFGLSPAALISEMQFKLDS